MKFKRILTRALVLALTLPLLSVSAHPGRTDGSGDHTDTDTGDYHYHHGADDHEHIDLDGDGILDCTLNTPEKQLKSLFFGIIGLLVLFGFPILSMFLMGVSSNLHRIRRHELAGFIGATAVFVGIVNFIGSFIVYFILGDFFEPLIDRCCEKLFPPNKPQPRPPASAPEKEPLCGALLLEQRRSRHKKHCAFLWSKAPAFLKASGIPSTNRNCAYVFSALFYISVKVMRSKAFSSEVYAQFPDVIYESMRIQNAQYVGAIIQAYRQIAPELNASGIDPLTPDGLDLLWSFLLSKLSSSGSANDNAKPRFTLLAANIIRNTSKFRDSETGPVFQYSIGELPDT